MDEYTFMDIFLDTKSTREVTLQAGTVIFQYISVDYIVHWMKFGTTCFKERRGMTDQQRDSTPNRVGCSI